MRIFSRCLLAAVLCAVTAVPGLHAAAAPYDGIVVFGTSLSDSGNAFALVGENNTPPNYLIDPLLLVPSAPYARGGHHFSNGATWIEQYARSRGLAGSVRPAFAAAGSEATNYAVGAARAREDGVNLNLGAQVGRFLLDHNGQASAHSLYVIEIGGNDVRDAFVVYAGGGDGSIVLQTANAAIKNSVQALYAAGARRFLIWRVPNVGRTPALRTQDQLNPGSALFAALLTQSFNAGLDGVVAQLSAILPGIDIVRLDAFALIEAMVAAPTAFGLTDVTTACVTPGAAPFTCGNPDEYLFWDGIHPTKAVHAIVAQAAADALGG